MSHSPNYSVKSIRKHFKENGIFYTSNKQASFMRSFFSEEIEEIYDPTCGHGNLLAVFPESTKKYGQDINDIAIEYCQANIPNFYGCIGSTLEKDLLNRKFKYVIGNPPFSVKYEPESIDKNRLVYAPIDEKGNRILPPPSKADWAFNLHILDVLENDGVAVVMNFPGVLYRGQKEYEIRKHLIELNLIEEVVHIPPKQFEDTAIATCLIIYRKNKANTDITFTNVEHDIQVTVPIEDIRANDYNLSVNQYAYIEEESEEIDINAVGNKLDAIALSNIERHMEMKKFTQEAFGFGDGMPLNKFITCVEQILKRFKYKTAPAQNEVLF